MSFEVQTNQKNESMVNFHNQHPADIAEQLTEMDKRERNLSFLMLSSEKKTLVFPFLKPAVQIEIIKSLGNIELSNVLNNLPPDNRTRLLRISPTISSKPPLTF